MNHQALLNNKIVLDVRDPRGGEWIRVNPAPTARKELTVMRDDDGQIYAVAEHMIKSIAKEKLQRTMAFMAQNKDGENFLWLVRSPVPENHLAFLAMKEWICYPTLH